MPRLQLIFCLFWLSTILRDIALFVAIVIGDLTRIFLFDITGRLGITFSNRSITVLVFLFVAFFLIRLFLLFFPGFLREFFGLRALFGHVSFTLAIKGYARFLGLFRLIVPGIEVHFQRLSFSGTLLI